MTVPCAVAVDTLRALDLFEMELVQEGRSPATVRGYLQDVRGFLRRTGALSLGDVDAMMVRRDCHARRLAGIGAATIRRELAALKCFFGLLCREGLLASNPAQGVRTPRPRQRMPVYLSAEEAAVLLRAPDAYTLEGVRDRAVLSVLVFCGLRNAEIRALRVEDLDMDARTLRVIRGKCDRDRLVPLSAQVHMDLTRWLLMRDRMVESTSALFPGRSGGRLTCSGLTRIVKRAVAAAGLPKTITPHKLRHTFATLLHAQDVDVLSIQALLGHADIQTTMIYTHLQVKTTARAVSKLDDAVRLDECSVIEMT